MALFKTQFCDNDGKKIYYEFDIHSLAQDGPLQWDADVKQGIIIGIL